MSLTSRADAAVVLTHTLDDPTPTPRQFLGDGFGRSVSLDGNRVLIGADRDSTNGQSVGQAHLFDATTGALLRTFDEPTLTEFVSFGFGVAVQGGLVLIGANGANVGGDEAGLAYLFDRRTGDLLEVIGHPVPIAGREFGWSVALDGDQVLVGAIGDTTNGTGVGQAYLFAPQSAIAAPEPSGLLTLVGGLLGLVLVRCYPHRNREVHTVA